MTGPASSIRDISDSQPPAKRTQPKALRTESANESSPKKRRTNILPICGKQLRDACGNCGANICTRLSSNKHDICFCILCGANPVRNTSPQTKRIPLIAPVAIWPPWFAGCHDNRWTEADNKKRVFVCDNCNCGFPGELKLSGSARVKLGGYVQECTRATIQRGRDPETKKPRAPFKDLVKRST